MSMVSTNAEESVNVPRSPTSSGSRCCRFDADRRQRGVHHPHNTRHPQQPRQRLPEAGPRRRGDRDLRAAPRHLRTDLRPRAPRADHVQGPAAHRARRPVRQGRVHDRPRRRHGDLPRRSDRRSAGRPRRADARFSDACQGCPLAQRCTTSTAGRTIHLGPHEQQLARARARQADPEWKAVHRHPCSSTSTSTRSGTRRCTT